MTDFSAGVGAYALGDGLPTAYEVRCQARHVPTREPARGHWSVCVEGVEVDGHLTAREIPFAGRNRFRRQIMSRTERDIGTADADRRFGDYHLIDLRLAAVPALESRALRARCSDERGKLPGEWRPEFRHFIARIQNGYEFASLKVGPRERIGSVETEIGWLRRGHLRLISNSPKATAGRRQRDPSSFGVARHPPGARSHASQIFQGAGRAQLNEMGVIQPYTSQANYGAIIAQHRCPTGQGPAYAALYSFK